MILYHKFVELQRNLRHLNSVVFLQHITGNMLKPPKTNNKCYNNKLNYYRVAMYYNGLSY